MYGLDNRAASSALPVEAGGEPLVGGAVRADELERDLAALARVDRPPHLAHAARTEAVHQPVRTECAFGHRALPSVCRGDGTGRHRRTTRW